VFGCATSLKPPDSPGFGVTIHRLVAQIDAGPILTQTRLALQPETTSLEAALRLHDAAVPMLVDTLDALERGVATEHDATLKPYCGFPTGEQLKTLARNGRRITSWKDVGRALHTPI
jgi:methionyl-tRNA formyltransferase